MNESAIVTQAPVAQAIHQGKYGFHACDYATYLMLKELNKLSTRVRSQLATHHRWSRKWPKNRVSRPRIRNDKGQVIGYGLATPISEPRVSKFVNELYQLPLDRLGGDPRNGSTVWCLVIRDYRNVKRPAVSPELVQPMLLPVAEIQQLYARWCAPKAT